jgi:hypothetical protein
MHRLTTSNCCRLKTEGAWLGCARAVVSAPGVKCRTGLRNGGARFLIPTEREIRREMYNTLLVAPDGKTSVFARH